MDARGRSGRHAREGKLKFRPVPDPVQPAVPPDHPVATYRFVVGGYVRKCVELQISCRVESCCIGDRDQSRELVASYKLSSTSSSYLRCNHPVIIITTVTEKIGSPLIILVSDFGFLDMRLAIENLTQQQQEDDDDPDLHDDARNARGAPRGNRPRGWAPIGRNGRGHDEEDGLGKPKFSIPKFEGGADVEEYLTWELKIEKLWSLHPHYTEDRKIKLASSEFDGYALRWWDQFVRAREEDGEPPIITWRAMKAAMTERFVPTNYLRNIFDKLTLLRQGVKTVDEYYMEMEMLMQRGLVKESPEMTMTRFLNCLKYEIKGIVRHYSYTTMNELLHHAREAESQLADEAKIKGRASGAGRYTPRAPPTTAPAPSARSAPYSTPPSKPVSNVSNTKKSESAASTSGSNMSIVRTRDMACHTCGGKGHFKRDCPNRKVMIINEDNEYETGDDVDPNAPR
ncbi:hypothetical protein QYE76_006518 [Lolium multiflorum]|uniref:CCHC-type domain-containing protein n=1 Tax=Lolium multiflorum TaxID=4521 RepID=A0AAD8RUV7_LOLMU|nr:hypothetical protein QYE76_006518 [Lolium multiflorum]